MKRLLITLAGLVILIAVVGTGLLLGIGHYLSPQNPLAHSDAIVAISGGDTNSRADEAIRLYKAGYAPTLIFSGAALDQSSPSNAKAMERLAIAQGVPAGHILLDEASQNTIQNASAVAALLRGHQLKSIILVTSPYHQRRADLTFRHALGSTVTIINHSAPDPVWSASTWWHSTAGIKLTLSELQKTLFLEVAQHV